MTIEALAAAECLKRRCYNGSGGIGAGFGELAQVTARHLAVVVPENGNGSVFGSKATCSRYVLFAAEKHWKYQGRAFLYCILLLYCFIGMAAITSLFMRALESIVRQTREVRRTNPVTKITEVKREKIWNSTLADITLLALGTSAPPLAISIIDAFQTLGKTDYGSLGPGTIVGAAAFNVFPIFAVCVLVPKNGAVKKIANLGVYLVELVWSVWAYVWLLIILQFSSRGSINVWEAIFTVLQFPVLMLHAYAQDRGWRNVALPIGQRGGGASLDISGLEHGQAAAGSVGGTTTFQQATELQQKKPGWLGESKLMGEIADVPFQRLSHDNHENQSGGESGRIVEGEESSVPGLVRLSSMNEQIFTWEEVFEAWRYQFVDAGKVRSGEDVNGKEVPPSRWHIFKHYVWLPWRMIFALNPPSVLAHGWVAFVGAIIFIIGLSVVVIKLVHVLACVTGISSFVLAITVLAAGTSWPDLVASKIAAEHSETADSAIANIIASNSINVYVGIGVPWLIQTFHSRLVEQQDFKTPANGLSYAVVVYFVLLVLCILVVSFRRVYWGGELGGPPFWAWASSCFFLALWIAFVILTCLYYYHKV